MTATYVNSLGTIQTSNSQDFVLDLPTGISDGDLLLAYCVTNTSTVWNSTAGDSGEWTLVQGIDDIGGGDAGVALFYKIASSEGSTVSLTTSTQTNERGFGAILVYTNVKSGDEIGNSSQSTGGGSATYSGPAITPPENGCLILTMIGTDPGPNYSADPDDSPAATERFDESDASNYGYIFVQEYESADTSQVTLDSRNLSIDSYGGISITLPPAAAANQSPSVTLNTADSTEFNTHLPTVEFTGSDPDSDSITYQVQISTDTNFTGTILTSSDEVTGGNIHPNPITDVYTWQGYRQVDDRPGQSFKGIGGTLEKISVQFGVDVATDGDAVIHVYEHSGVYGSGTPLNPADPTDTPTQGWIAESEVRYFDTGGGGPAWRDFNFTGENRLVLTSGDPYFFILDWRPNSFSYDNTIVTKGDTSLSDAGNAYIDGYDDFNNGIQSTFDFDYRIYESWLILDSGSDTSSSFLNTVTTTDTDPFNSDEKVAFTVPTGSELPNGDYYWRVRGIDPGGTNTYGDWATYRGFTVYAVLTLSPLTGLHHITSDNVDLTQHNVLAIDDSYHSLTSDNVDLVQHYALVIDDAYHSHSAENVDLVQHNILVIDDAYHTHTAENVDLVQHNILSIDNTYHSLTSTNIDTEITIIAFRMSSLSMTSKDQHIDTVSDLTNANLTSLTANQSGGFYNDPVLVAYPASGATDVSSAESNNSYFEFSFTPSAGYEINMDRLWIFMSRTGSNTPTGYGLSRSGNGYVVSGGPITTESPQWTSLHQDALGTFPDCQLVADTYTFRIYVYGPSTSDGLYIDDIELRGTVIPAVVGDTSNHSIISGHVALIQHNTLEIDDSYHGHTAENVDLLQHYVLSISDSYHDHTAENVVLAGVSIQLEIQDAYHALTSENIDLTQHNVLEINNASHAHTSENVDLIPRYGVIIDIDHEEGDLSDYTSYQDGGGDLSVQAGAALAGTNYGLQVVYNDTSGIYGQYQLSTSSITDAFRIRFYIDTNGIGMTSGDEFFVLDVTNDTPVTIEGLTLSYDGANYRIRVAIVTDAGGYSYTNYYNISDNVHFIEMSLIRSSSDIASDGSLQLWIDGVSQETVSSVDNYDRFANFYRIRIGAVGALDSGTNGTFYIDEIIARDDTTEIGPALTILEIQNSSHIHTADNVDLTQHNILEIDNSSHLHSAENLDLVQHYVLVIDSSTHVVSSDNVPLTQHNVLAIDNAYHSLTSDALDLIQHNVLSIDDSYHEHIADNVVLGIALLINDAYHAIASDNLDLIQHYFLIIDDSYHSHIAENLDLIVALIIDDSYHVISSENVDLIQHNILTIDDAYHGHIADNITLTPAGQLEVQNGYHDHSAENLDLIQHNVLSIDDSYHPLLSENLDLIQHYVLFIDDSYHSQTADNLDLIQHNILSIDDSFHAHSAENIDLIQQGSLPIDDAYHNHIADNVDLVQHNILVIDDATHSITSDNIDFIQHNVLSIDDAYHILTSENVILGVVGQLTIQDASHSHIAENIDLTQHNILEVSDSYHSLSSETFYLGVALDVNNSDHSHSAENVDLIQHNILSVANSEHSHSSENVELIQHNILSLENTIHSVTSDNISFNLSLIINNADHAHSAENVILFAGYRLLIANADHGLISDSPAFTQHNVLDILDATNRITSSYLTLEGFTRPGRVSTSNSARGVSLSHARVGTVTTRASHNHVSVSED